MYYFKLTGTFVRNKMTNFIGSNLQNKVKALMQMSVKTSEPVIAAPNAAKTKLETPASSMMMKPPQMKRLPFGIR